MKFFRRWLIAILAGAATFFVRGGISHLCCSKELALPACPTRNEAFRRFAPPCREMVCISSRVSISDGTSAEEKAAWEGRSRASPTGMIIYQAAGDTPVSSKKLSVKFLSDVLAAGVVSYLLSLASATYIRPISFLRWRVS
jgi:hypothetical protein